MRWALAGLAMIALAACSSPAPEEAKVQSYTVSGVVRQLPSGPSSELMIEHEAIEDFVSASGDTVGMSAMTMGFPPAEGLSIEGIAIGDSVVFQFEVRWEGSPPLQLVQLKKR